MTDLTCEPLAAALQDTLDAFQSQSTQLFAQLSNLSANSVQSCLEDLRQTDRRLASLLSLVPKHQSNQERITALTEQLKSFDGAYKEDVARAYTLRGDLSALIQSGHKSQSRSLSGIPASDILNLGRQLAPFTSAPVLSPAEKSHGNAQEAALRARGAIPPFPTEDIMRRGYLGIASNVANEQQNSTEGVHGLGVGTVGVAGGQEPKRNHQAKEHEGGRYDAYGKGGYERMDPEKQREVEERERRELESAFDLDLNPDLDDD